jgi:hypothetical protein
MIVKKPFGHPKRFIIDISDNLLIFILLANSPSGFLEGYP